MTRPWARDERGSAAIEAVIGVPAFLLFVALIILRRAHRDHAPVR
jgi:Flp pilus assembly protein TadG